MSSIMGKAIELGERYDDCPEDALDEAVNEAAASIGSRVNNSGICEQIRFLLQEGVDEAEIESMLKDALTKPAGAAG